MVTWLTIFMRVAFFLLLQQLAFAVRVSAVAEEAIHSCAIVPMARRQGSARNVSDMLS